MVPLLSPFKFSNELMSYFYHQNKAKLKEPSYLANLASGMIERIPEIQLPYELRLDNDIHGYE